jgi:hypothetical protein
MRKLGIIYLSILLFVMSFASTAFAGTTGYDNRLMATVQNGNNVTLQYGNMLYNGSFEVEGGPGSVTGGAQGWEWPWIDSADIVRTFSIDSTVKNKGSKSQKIVASSLTSDTGIYLGGGHPAVEGDTIFAGISVNISSITDAKVSARIIYDDVDGERISEEPTTVYTTNTSGWVNVSLSGVAPALTDDARLQVMINGTELTPTGSVTVHFDDAFLRKENTNTYRVLADGVEVYSGSSNTFLHTGAPTTSSPIIYTVEYYDGSSTLIGTDSTEAPVQGNNSSVNTQILGGDLEFTTSPLTLTSVTINNSATLTATGSSTITTSDNTGEGDGWDVRVSGTSFISSLLPDPTSGGTGQYQLEIPISELSLVAGSVVLVNGQSINPIEGPIAASVTLSGSAQSIFTAATGFGMGSYNVPVDFSLNVPKTVKILTLAGTGSTYTVGDEIGTVATTYVSTITYTIGSGI